MKIIFIIPVFLICSCTSYKYENKNELQKLIGLEIPSYKIVDSKMTHSARFDSEKTTKVTIKFNNKIDSNTYKTLDSLCSLPFQNNPNVSSSYFYSSVEAAQRCLVNDYSEEMKLIFNEGSLGIYLKETTDLIQISRRSLMKIHNFIMDRITNL